MFQALRMTLKWLPETREWRLRVVEGFKIHAEHDYYAAASAGPSRQMKAEAWWDAMATAQDMAQRLHIVLPEDFGIQGA